MGGCLSGIYLILPQYRIGHVGEKKGIGNG